MMFCDFTVMTDLPDIVAIIMKFIDISYRPATGRVDNILFVHP